jgi:hypothetical protein
MYTQAVYLAESRAGQVLGIIRSSWFEKEYYNNNNNNASGPPPNPVTP